MKFTIETNKLIDLTRPVSPDVAGVSWKPAKIYRKDGWNATTLELYSHAGTHMDAPYHFEVTPSTIDQYPVSRFFSKTHVIDIKSKEPGQIISVADLDGYWEKIQPGESVLLRLGWHKIFGSPAYKDDLPRVSVPLAKRLVEANINMLAVEAPSVADVNNLPEVTRIHEILLGGDIIIIEGLTNTEQIKSSEILMVALPLKVKDGDGAPARVVAFELE
jgi:kynurenine formamidase